MHGCAAQLEQGFAPLAAPVLRVGCGSQAHSLLQTHCLQLGCCACHAIRGQSISEIHIWWCPATRAREGSTETVAVDLWVGCDHDPWQVLSRCQRTAVGRCGIMSTPHALGLILISGLNSQSRGLMAGLLPVGQYYLCNWTGVCPHRKIKAGGHHVLEALV